MRPRIFDCFPLHDELDILECRLTELYDAVDRFVVVEANVTHQGHPRPSYYLDDPDRWSPWADKITHVWADRMPSREDDPDPWSREYAQREWIAAGLPDDLAPHDIILQSDVDEIPRALQVINTRGVHRPRFDENGNPVQVGFTVFAMRLHCFAVDWLHPDPWHGTVATTAGFLSSVGPGPFSKMRNARNRVTVPPGFDDAGWHFSWMGAGDPKVAAKKADSFAHPEVAPRVYGSIDNDNFYWREGWHVDGTKMKPVDVDASWPKWIVEGNAPESWYRPR